MPATLGSLPIGVPWFGALGAVMISLAGIVDHRKNWDSTLKYWHFTRPLVGAALASISVLIFQAGILAVGASPTPASGTVAPTNLLYYLIAFVVGYREEVFRELIKRVADVILTPGSGAPPPQITMLAPATGKVSGGDSVAITGSGFTEVVGVLFGPSPAVAFQVNSASQITATTPQGPQGLPGPVGVTVVTKSGSVTGGQFTFV